ncbi:hypothetical protein PXT33_001970 [Faecalibacterium taiwanense]
MSAIYVDAPDKSSGKRVQHIHIKYDGLGYIPLDELEAKKRRDRSHAKSSPFRELLQILFYGNSASGNFLFFFSCKMSLFCLPCGKLSLSFLAVPAGKDGRVERPCQTVDDFIGIRGSVCGLFLFVQTHAPLIVPPWQSRARKSKFQFLSGARARMLSALHLRLVAR